MAVCPASRVGLCLPDSYAPDPVPTAMCEMIKIMQEYGEVTCCLGSSANLRNSCLFLQSDIRSGGYATTSAWSQTRACVGLGTLYG